MGKVKHVQSKTGDCQGKHSPTSFKLWWLFSFRLHQLRAGDRQTILEIFCEPVYCIFWTRIWSNYCILATDVRLFHCQILPQMYGCCTRPLQGYWGEWMTLQTFNISLTIHQMRQPQRLEIWCSLFPHFATTLKFKHLFRCFSGHMALNITNPSWLLSDCHI